MIIGCFAGFVFDADKLILIGSSLILAVITILALKGLRLSTKAKVGLIYTHLVFLFFPFAVLTTNIACGAMCMSCGNTMMDLALISLPTSVALQPENRNAKLSHNKSCK